MEKISVVAVRSFDRHLIEKFKKMEWEAFQDGGFNEWILPVFIRYGRVYALKNGKDYIGLAHFIRDFNDAQTCFLAGFTIRKDQRGKGLGASFLKSVLGKLFLLGIHRVQLTASADNVQALKIYKQLDFEKVKLLKDEYGPGRDRLLLCKSLLKEV